METLPALQEQQVEHLIAQAIDKAVPVETMERLLAMRKELKQEYAQEEFNRAMSEFQMECPVIEKTRESRDGNGLLLYKYAPIEDIVSQVKPLLRKHGFRFKLDTQVNFEKKYVAVICVVTHTGGHSEETPLQMPFIKQTKMMSDTQVVAGTVTMAKRYVFQNAFGIMTGDEDLDGKNLGKEEEQPKPELISPDQIAKLKELLNKTGFTEEAMLKACSVDTIEAMTSGQAIRIMGNLQRKLEKDQA